MGGFDRLDPDSSHWHWLAADLRIWRRERSFTQVEVAEALDVDPSTVSNLEAGRAKLRQEHAEILDQVWKTRGHFARLRRLADSDHDPNWRRQNIQQEAQSTVIRAFESSLVPGLLQTEHYARAGFRSAGIAEARMDELWEERLARQAILHRTEPPQLYVLLDQAVISRHVGGPKVMTEQLAHLLEMGESPHVMLRVIPWEAGAHMGQDGAFKLMTVPKGDVVYVEAAIEGRLITDPVKIHNVRLRWERVGAAALPETLSRSLIVDHMESMR